MNTFRLHIWASEKPFYDGDCLSLIIPSVDGKYGIMAKHSNTITAIVPGELTFTTADGKTQIAARFRRAGQDREQRCTRPRRDHRTPRGDRREQGESGGGSGKGSHDATAQPQGVLYDPPYSCPCNEQIAGQRAFGQKQINNVRI